MSEYYLGIDLGGTKSHALIADERGQAMGLGKAGPGNHETVGYEEMSRVLLEITNQALTEAAIERSQVRAAGFGIAGYDWESELPAMQAAIDSLGLECPLELVNDALIGLAAGAEKGWGIAVVAGTGCNCWGWDEQRRIGRVTGYGPAMAEGAGAGDRLPWRSRQSHWPGASGEKPPHSHKPWLSWSGRAIWMILSRDYALFVISWMRLLLRVFFSLPKPGMKWPVT